MHLTAGSVSFMEAANTGIKQVEPTGYRDPGNHRARILFTSAARTAA